MKTKNMRRMAAAMAVVIATGMAANCGYQRNVIIARALRKLVSGIIVSYWRDYRVEVN